MSEKLAILVGGGPAPGINGVIEAAATEAIRQGKEVSGIFEGFKWLSKGDTTHTLSLNSEDVHGIEQRGGSILRTSRDNPSKSPEKMANCLAALSTMQVRYLITIGGDDTSHSARLLAQKAGGTISVVHVPKTIDNDLPLPSGVPTFGFETAKELGARLVFSLLEDARTSSRWYIVVSMGRSAGFLGLSIALAAGAPLALIPEEFPLNTPLQTIIDIIEGSILKRLSLGKDFGVCVISEGVAQRLRSSDFHFIDKVGRDEHGNIKLADVPLGAVVRQELEKSLTSLGINMKLIAKDIGFELRACPPCAFDREYTRQLGVCAVRFLLEQKGTNAMITFHQGKAEPVPFDSLVDPTTGKTRVKLVDTSSDYFINSLRLMERLQKEDLQDREKLNAIAGVSGMNETTLINRFGYLIG
jgi:6-phosphofructokinase 1